MTSQQLYERAALRMKLAADALWDAQLALTEAGGGQGAESLASAARVAAQQWWQSSDAAWDLAAAAEQRADSLWGHSC